MPTKEQLESFIRAAKLELGPDGCEPWAKWCEDIIRDAFERFQSARLGTWDWHSIRRRSDL